eukprot:8640772-Pyramimonas_sp.AAC.1
MAFLSANAQTDSRSRRRGSYSQAGFEPGGYCFDAILPAPRPRKHTEEETQDIIERSRLETSSAT